MMSVFVSRAAPRLISSPLVSPRWIRRHLSLRAGSVAKAELSTIPESSSEFPRPKLVSEHLNSLVDRGELLYDSAQEHAARRLTVLQKTLKGYTNRQSSLEPKSEGRMSHNVENIDTERLPRVPRGLFLHGEVGTGKSMMMDTFFKEAPVKRKRRVHFHSFMQEVHSRIYELKKSDLRKHGRDFQVDTTLERNPIYRVAMQLADEICLLCFDEFQVTDVADALILSQLFSVLFSRGVVMVATSNRPPSDLYEGGINRSYFLPFIDLIHSYCIVHEMKTVVDYRQLLGEGIENVFFVDACDSDSSTEKCDDIFSRLLNGEDEVVTDLPVSFNRSIKVMRSDVAGQVGRFEFDELCNKELGSSDYRAIAERFEVCIIEKIPRLTLKEHDQARRFITLVDELYEAKCSLVCSAVAYPAELFRDSHEVVREHHSASTETKAGELFGIDVAQNNGKALGELASVRELSFAFRRAASRLTEMCSRDWWAKSLNDKFMVQ